MENAVLTVFVLYNTNLFDCDSYKSFLTGDLGVKKKILVYDNSPEPQHEYHDLENIGIVYIHDHSNSGVSGAYNRAAKYAKQYGYNWLLILDQDTKYQSDTICNYVAGLTAAHTDNTIAIISPLLFRCNDMVNSPVKNFCGRYITIKDKPKPGIYDLTHYSCMNSGLMINLNCFNEIGGYDNELFYFSDHDFCHRLGLANKKMYLSGVKANHFPAGSDNTLEKLDLFKRYSIVVKDGMKFSKKISFIYKLGTYSVLFTRLVKLIIITRSLKPISILLKGE